MITTDEMIAIIRANQRGDTVQARDSNPNHLRGWCDITRACWPPNFQSWEYRIKPEPREWYGEVLNNGQLHIHNNAIEKAYTKGGELVKVREVI